MRDIPIIFSAPMIQALLDGRKTMTRRLLYRLTKNFGSAKMLVGHPPIYRVGTHGFPLDHGPGQTWTLSGWERVKPGDRLWVRENLYEDASNQWRYSADDALVSLPEHDPRISAMIAWAHHKEGDQAPSIHMPRWASRLTLVVTATKIERLQDISRDDAVAEGLKLVSAEIEEFFRWPAPFDQGTWLTPPAAFAWLWKQLHGPEAWDANPEVVALTFTVHKQNIDTMLAEAA